MLDHAHRASDSYPNLRDKRILVVEDDVVIAADYHFQLREVGAEPRGYKPTSKAALDYLATHEIDAVIVDYRQRAIPFVIVTGNAFELRASLNAPCILSKPIAPADIWNALSEILH